MFSLPTRMMEVKQTDRQDWIGCEWIKGVQEVPADGHEVIGGI